MPYPMSASKPAIEQGWQRVLLILPIWVVFEIMCYIPLYLLAPEYSNYNRKMTANVEAMLFLQCSAMAGTLGAVYFTWQMIDKKPFVSLGFAFNSKSFLSGTVGGIVLILLITTLMILLGAVSIKSSIASSLQVGALLILYILVGITEEVLVRGYILNNLMDSFNNYVALVVSSIFFGLLHGLNSHVSWVGLLNITLSGVLMGMYYVHRKNLWFPIGMHFAWNFTQGPILGFNVSGMSNKSLFIQQTTDDLLLTGGDFGLEGSILTTPVLIAAIVLIHYLYRPKP